MEESEEEAPPPSPVVMVAKMNKHHSEMTMMMLFVRDVAHKLISGDLEARIAAARDIRHFIRKSNLHALKTPIPSSSSLAAKARSRFAAAGVIPPLVSMLHSPSPSPQEAALLALLNLAARNDRNKVTIVTSGAIAPLVELLNNSQLRELATATILTLSTVASNKRSITSAGVVPLLVQILSSGSVQGRVDAVTALYNLCTCEEEPTVVLDARAVSPLINLLKDCKKYSKFAEKTTALLEILCNSEEGRLAVTNVAGGILTIVETIEDGSLVSTKHAVGCLLSLCHSCREKYRVLILGEGAIPGLLRLTVEGAPEAQEKAKTLLDMLRDSRPKRRLSTCVLEKIIHSMVDGADENAAETAKRLLEDVVQRSMELSMRRIQLRGRALSGTSSKV